MTTFPPNPPPSQKHDSPEALPALDQLRLSAAERSELARQGFVAAERRGQRVVFKLRFRVKGRQQVRCLSGGLAQARAVEEELAQLQHQVRLQRELSACGRAAARQLRAAKTALEPRLEAVGFYFHGRAIRKRRQPKSGAESKI